MRTFSDVDELAKAIGEHLGYSSWHRVTQQQIDLFAEATGDHQWIHTDPEKAASGPFCGPIAHGYLTLSLVPMLIWQVYEVRGAAMTVNYGSDRVRYVSILPVDSEIRAGVELLDLTRGVGYAQLRSLVTVERREADKPVCTAEILTRIGLKE
jgi:acyl dehydratase